MILNQLQMLALSPMYKQVGVKYMDMKDKLGEMSKDQELMLTPFDACRKLLTTSDGARLSFKDRMDMFFIDHSLAPLLVQENYLKSVEKKPVDAGLLARCAFSADLMTLGDIMSNRIRGEQEWNLLPDMGVVSSVYPAMATNGFVGFPSFPQFLGKYSTMSRTRRLNAELQTHLRLSATVSSQSLPMSGYTDLLFKKCIRPMLQGKPDAVLETIKVLDAYGLRREHLTEHLTELRQHLGEEDLFKLVDPKVKAAMTREMNSGSHAPKVMIPTKKGRKVAEAENPAEGMEDDDAEIGTQKLEDEAAESDDDVGTLVKVKTKTKAKGKAKAKAKAEGADAAAKAKNRKPRK